MTLQAATLALESAGYRAEKWHSECVFFRRGDLPDLFFRRYGKRWRIPKPVVDDAIAQVVLKALNGNI